MQVVKGQTDYPHKHNAHVYKHVMYAYLLTFSLFSSFLCHVPVAYVDYPGFMSLTQIYGTFNRAVLQVVPNLRAYSDTLTNAMVEFNTMSQVREDERKADLHGEMFTNTYHLHFLPPSFFLLPHSLLFLFLSLSLSPPIVSGYAVSLHMQSS